MQKRGWEKRKSLLLKKDLNLINQTLDVSNCEICEMKALLAGLEFHSKRIDNTCNQFNHSITSQTKAMKKKVQNYEIL